MKGRGSSRVQVLQRKPTFVQDDLIVNSRDDAQQPRPSKKRKQSEDMEVMARNARGRLSSARVAPIETSAPTLTRVVPMHDTSEAEAPTKANARGSRSHHDSLGSQRASRLGTRSEPHTHRRVIQYGASLPVIFVLSVAIAVSYLLAMLKSQEVVWQPQDLTGDREWTSTTRTHLAQAPVVFFDDLFRVSTIGEDTSVSVAFLKKYSVAIEANPQSTASTFNATWLTTDFILQNGFAVAGIMAGSFEGYATWPCALVLPRYPDLLHDVCADDPVGGWVFIEIFNNLVATTSEKASTYLSLGYTPMSLMSTRVWAATPPKVTPNGVVLHGYKEGTYTERAYWLLKTERENLSLARVVACDRTTQSNARECDRLEGDNVYIRNIAKRDFEPPSKLDKIKVYGPAYAMGNFEAAGKLFVQLPATAIMMTSTGYSATTRFGTIIPIRLTIARGTLMTESNVYQVASCTKAVGNGVALATVQLILLCLVVYNAIAHCRAPDDVVMRESRIFGFKNQVTMGMVARRLGTYKIVFVQLCVYHGLNVGSFFTASYYNTQKTTDTIAFGAEGLLLVTVSSALLDQLIFFEKYSSVRETLTAIGSAGSYIVYLYLQSRYFISIAQVQVTELPVCAGANQCVIVYGHHFYGLGLLLVLLGPVAVVALPVHRFVTPTRSQRPSDPVASAELTSFEKFCLGIDARREFGCFDRSTGATPISIVHAAGFTYVGSYLVRVKDYYMVVLVRRMPLLMVESCGLTLTIFKMRDGRVVSGQHMALVAAFNEFREAKNGHYVAIR